MTNIMPSEMLGSAYVILTIIYAVNFIYNKWRLFKHKQFPSISPNIFVNGQNQQLYM